MLLAKLLLRRYISRKSKRIKVNQISFSDKSHIQHGLLRAYNSYVARSVINMSFLTAQIRIYIW